MATWFVSRHPGAVAWATGQGIRVDHHTAHLNPTHVLPTDTVIGTLPLHLAAEICKKGAQFFSLTLDLPAHWRGRELSAADLMLCNARLECFEVTHAVHIPNP